MKTAVMYGAGNIGRGFVGALMSGAGYRVSFVDVDRELVAALNRRGAYPLRVIRNEGHEDSLVAGIQAIDGRDNQAVADAIAQADLMATAVGARVLPHIAPLIAQGLKQRFRSPAAPLNILICENLMDANKVLESLVKQHLTPDEARRFEKEVGLVEASIGRMVPIQTEELRAGDPLRVCVEAYGFLPVDRDAFRGAVPDIPGLVPYSPFDFYIKRKLYLHNLGHAVCAYLGLYTGKTHIYEAMAEPRIELMVRGAMQESAAALSSAYAVPFQDLAAHTEDLLYRFNNRALGDSTARVGADIPRKLAREDRLVGAALLCLKQGISPVFIALGAAAALHAHLASQLSAPGADAARQALFTLSSLGEDDRLFDWVLRFERLFAEGTSLEALYRAALEEKHRLAGPVV